jgi:hypothetical protein
MVDQCLSVYDPALGEVRKLQVFEEQINKFVP